MPNILLLNFGKELDILRCASLIQSLVSVDQKNRVFLATLKKNSRLCKNLKGLEKTFFIDSDRITGLKSNSLFSDGLALECLLDAVDPMTNIVWDLAINTTQDPFSNYLISYLAPKTVQGPFAGKDLLVQHSSGWSIFLGEILGNSKPIPLHPLECLHHMTGTLRPRDITLLSTLEEHNHSAKSYLGKLRNIINQGLQGNGKAKLVGIKIKADFDNQEISFGAIRMLIQNLLEEQRFYPLLIISTAPEERKLSDEINKVFRNNLLTVETDTTTLPSVLAEIDLLISSDDIVCALADLCNAPTIKAARSRKITQGIYPVRPGNLVVEIPESSDEEVDAQFGELLFQATLFFFYPTEAFSQIESAMVPIYRVHVDDQGPSLRVYNQGPELIQKDLSWNMGRFYLQRMLLNVSVKAQNNLLVDFLRGKNKQEIRSFINKEKAALAQALTELLNTLRELKQTKLDTRNGPQFIQNLDRLLVFEKNPSLSSLPVLHFRSKLDSLAGSDFALNILGLEGHLFAMKGDFQILNTLFAEVEAAASTDRSTQSFESRQH